MSLHTERQSAVSTAVGSSVQCSRCCGDNCSCASPMYAHAKLSRSSPQRSAVASRSHPCPHGAGRRRIRARTPHPLIPTRRLLSARSVSAFCVTAQTAPRSVPLHSERATHDESPATSCVQVETEPQPRGHVGGESACKRETIGAPFATCGDARNQPATCGDVSSSFPSLPP